MTTTRPEQYGQSVGVHFKGGGILQVHSFILQKLKNLDDNYVVANDPGSSDDFLAFDISIDAGHAVVHYLYMNCLELRAFLPDTSQSSDYQDDLCPGKIREDNANAVIVARLRVAFEVAAFSAGHGSVDLATAAQSAVDNLTASLSPATVLEIIEGTLADYDAADMSWLPRYIKGVVKSALPSEVQRLAQDLTNSALENPESVGPVKVLFLAIILQVRIAEKA
ncbi:hypothetical protein MN608_00231 [Microdochium nivale]|nr:hypothetical protein MN608_00231 [Microdochium nivale]